METVALKSRKIRAYVVVVLGVLALVAVTTTLRTPENVAIQSLWVVGMAGLFTIGGQSLVDSVAKWRAPMTTTATTTETIVKPPEVK